ncbi:MAG: hypothetical protein M1816_000596 [Peltula sp. TS41687]|nr:MAG: hypothetical protein M1816_000596 [Peltula sp. TS41687]
MAINAPNLLADQAWADSPADWKPWFYYADKSNIHPWITACSQEVYDAFVERPSSERGMPVIERFKLIKREKLAEAQAKSRAIARARARDAQARGRRVWISQPHSPGEEQARGKTVWAPKPRQQGEEGKGEGQSNAFTDLKAGIKVLGLNAMQAIGHVYRKGSIENPAAGFSEMGLPFSTVPGKFGFAP